MFTKQARSLALHDQTAHGQVHSIKRYWDPDVFSDMYVVEFGFDGDSLERTALVFDETHEIEMTKVVLPGGITWTKDSDPEPPVDLDDPGDE